MVKNQTNQTIEFSIMPFLAEAFSTNKKVYKHIDKIYNTDKLRFIQLAQQDEYYNHLMAKEGDIKQEYYYKKMLGLLNAAKEDKDIAAEIINICKVGWQYTYAYIQQNNIIKVSIFLDKYIKKNRGIDNITDDELNSNILILLFLGIQLEKNIDKTDGLYVETIQNYILRLQHYKKEYRIDINSLSKEDLKLLRNLELKIRSEGKIQPYPSSYRLNSEQYEGLKINIDAISKDDKYFLPFEYIFDLENLSLISIVSDGYFKSKDIQELIFCYTQFFREEKNESIDYEELKKFLYPAIQIRYLCREYKKAKEYFFENFNEELYKEISKMENENREIKKSNILTNSKNELLKLQIEELEKENKRLKQELSEGVQNKNELIALREFIFNLDKKVDQTNEEIHDFSKLNDINGVIVGGTPSWQLKMKEVLDSWKFINMENLNFNENIIKNSDIVFVYVNYLSHALYYKLMEIVNKSNVRIEYIVNNQNLSIVLRSMLHKLQ